MISRVQISIKRMDTARVVVLRSQRFSLIISVCFIQMGHYRHIVNSWYWNMNTPIHISLLDDWIIRDVVELGTGLQLS